MKKIYPIMAFTSVGIGVLAVCYLLVRLFMYGLSHDRSPGSGNYDPNNPGYEYAPEGDMYHSIPYDAQTEYYEDDNHFNTNKFNPFGMTMRLPVAGTVARGQADYYYSIPNTPEGYIKAGQEVHDPLPKTEENLAEGKRLFNINCWHCHGHLGNGDGPVMASGKFPKPSWVKYNSEGFRKIPEGDMFQTITYGKGLMGAHGRFITPKQRWQIIQYVQYLSTLPDPNAPKAGAASDSTKASAAAPAKPDSAKTATTKN